MHLGGGGPLFRFCPPISVLWVSGLPSLDVRSPISGCQVSRLWMSGLPSLDVRSHVSSGGGKLHFFDFTHLYLTFECSHFRCQVREWRAEPSQAKPAPLWCGPGRPEPSRGVRLSPSLVSRWEFIFWGRVGAPIFSILPTHISSLGDPIFDVR